MSFSIAGILSGLRWHRLELLAAAFLPAEIAFCSTLALALVFSNHEFREIRYRCMSLANPNSAGRRFLCVIMWLFGNEIPGRRVVFRNNATRFYETDQLDGENITCR